MSDQDRISPYNISTTSSRQVTKIKKYINKGIIKVTGHFAQKTFRTSLLAQILDHLHNS